MTSDETRKLLCGRWLHSHEEDTADQRVYRPADFPFPPSRGRSGFELKADRTGSRIGLAARDGSTTTPCTWALTEGDEPQIVLEFPEAEPLVFKVVSLSQGRLVVRR